MITLGHIITATAEVCAVTPDILTSPARYRDVAHPRQLAFTAARHLTRKSLSQIGRAFERDHTTVLHGLLAVVDRGDTEEAERLAEIEARAAELALGRKYTFKTTRKH